MTQLRALCRLESITPATLSGGRAPQRWQHGLQRSGAWLTTLDRSASWVDEIIGINLQLLGCQMWGDCLPQLVSYFFASSKETATNRRSPAKTDSHTHARSPSTARRPVPRKQYAPPAIPDDAEAEAHLPPPSRGQSGRSTRARNPAGGAARNTRPARDAWRANATSASQSQGSAESSRGQSAPRRDWPDLDTQQISLKTDSATNEPVGSALNSFLPDSSDAQRNSPNASEMPYRKAWRGQTRTERRHNSLNASEMPYRADNALLYRFYQQHELSLAEQHANTHGGLQPPHISTPQPGQTPYSFSAFNRESNYPAKSRGTASKDERLQREMPVIERHAIALPQPTLSQPTLPQPTPSHLQAEIQTAQKTDNPPESHDTATIRAFRMTHHESSLRTRRLAPLGQSAGKEERNAWQSQIAMRVSRLMNGNGFRVADELTPYSSEVAQDESGLLALGEQMAITLAGQTAPLDLLITFAGQTIHQDEMPGTGSSRNTTARSTVEARAEGVGFASVRRDSEFGSRDNERLQHEMASIERHAIALPQPTLSQPTPAHLQAEIQTGINAGSLASQSNGRKREIYQPPAYNSQESPGVPGSDSLRRVERSGERSFQDRQRQTPLKAIEEAEGWTSVRREAEFDSADVSLAVMELSAPRPAFFEQRPATFDTPTLPPLIPHQTDARPDLPVAVAVTRQGARSEALAGSEDLDALAEKIKLILDEQARRHGIDV